MGAMPLTSRGFADVPFAQFCHSVREIIYREFHILNHLHHHIHLFINALVIVAFDPT